MSLRKSNNSDISLDFIPFQLFPQLEALNTNMFGTFWEFTNRFCGAKYEYFGKKRYRKVK